MWLGSTYEGNARDWQVFDSTEDAEAWRDEHKGSVIWRAEVDESEQETAYPARIEAQRQAGLQFVGECSRLARVALGLTTEAAT